MSRGHGAVQARILERLRRISENYGLVWVLANDLGSVGDSSGQAGRGPTKSERQSAHRAIRRLEEEDHVETAKVRHKGRSRRVVRLRDRLVASPVSSHTDFMLLTAMRLQVAVYNEIAPSLGSRVRLAVYEEEQPEEAAIVFDPLTKQRYRGYYIYDRSGASDLSVREEVVKETARIFREHNPDGLEPFLKALTWVMRDSTPDSAFD